MTEWDFAHSSSGGTTTSGMVRATCAFVQRSISFGKAVSGFCVAITTLF